MKIFENRQTETAYLLSNCLKQERWKKCVCGTLLDEGNYKRICISCENKKRREEKK